MTTPLRALIFDVDGTLAETEEAHRDAFNRAFRDLGLPWFWNRTLYRQLLRVSGGKERLRAFIDQTEPHLHDADRLIAALHARKTEHYTAAVASGAVPLRAGVAAVIGQARAAGLTLAVATTTTRANVLALFDGSTKGAAHDWFATLVCADDAPAKKPDPMAYRIALERIGLSAAACLALEDSTNGVRAAVAAGIPVVVTESVYTAGDDFTGALKVVPDLSGITLAWLLEHHSEAEARR